MGRHWKPKLDEKYFRNVVKFQEEKPDPFKRIQKGRWRKGEVGSGSD